MGKFCRAGDGKIKSFLLEVCLRLICQNGKIVVNCTAKPVCKKQEEL